jgi:uncharacterized protein YjbI with pentapeptide repeats
MIEEDAHHPLERERIGRLSAQLFGAQLFGAQLFGAQLFEAQLFEAQLFEALRVLLSPSSQSTRTP